MTDTISNTIARFFAAVDRYDWPAVQACLTTPFNVDYSSYSGVDAADVTPADLTTGWSQILPYFDSIHHQIGNLVIDEDGETANAQCHGTAMHFIAEHPEGEVQWVVGTYDFTLVKVVDCWKLSSMRFNFKFTSGNKNLPAEAQRRAAQENAQ